MVLDGTKVVQAERNGKKKLFFLAFPRRSLPCPRFTGIRENYNFFATWHKLFE